MCGGVLNDYKFGTFVGRFCSASMAVKGLNLMPLLHTLTQSVCMHVTKGMSVKVCVCM